MSNKVVPWGFIVRFKPKQESLRLSLQFWGNREVAFEEDTISDDDGEDSDCDRLFRAKSCKALVCLSTHMPEQRVAKHSYA